MSHHTQDMLDNIFRTKRHRPRGGTSSTVIRNILHRILKPNTSIRVMSAHQHTPSIKNVPVALVFNTQPRDKRGEHWVCIYINAERRGFFFDSFGRSPLKLNKKCWLTLLKRNCVEFTVNKRAVQRKNSRNCGFFVMKTLLELNKGKGRDFSQFLPMMSESSIEVFKNNVMKM